MQIKIPGFNKPVLTIVAISVIAGSIYGGYTLTGGDDEAAAGEPLQVPVERGDLLEAVSSDGTLTFPERAELTFDSQGYLASIDVSPGDAVAVGDILATLDDLTIADLATAVERAETEVADAQDRLADARSPADALDIANAESAIVSARAALEDATDQLDALLAPSDDDLLRARTDITKAEKDLADAQETLDDLQTLDEFDLLSATTDVTKAEKTLADAREALADQEALPDAGDVAAAAVTVSLAQEAYDNAVADLALEEALRQTQLEDGQTAIDDARDAYAAQYQKWLGVALSETELSMPPSDVLAANNIDLTNLFDTNGSIFSIGAPEDDPATAWNELTVFVWAWLAVEPVVGSCDADSPPRGTACVSLELDNTWDQLVAAEDSLGTVEAQVANALTAERRSAEQAENSLASAQDALEAASEPAGPIDLQLAKDDILLAERALSTANDALTDLLQPANSLEVELAQNEILLAEAALTVAREALTDLGTPDETQLATVNADIVVAKGRLTEAITALAELQLIGTDEALIDLRSAEVDSAVAALTSAEDALEATSLRATMDGIVDAVHFEVGDDVRPQDTVISLVDPSVVTVETAIDQLDILAIAVGSQADITLDALAGQILSGEITEIDSATLNQSGTVTFPVTIVLDLQPGVELLEGLSATVDIVTSEIANVLLVPAAAVGGTFIQPTLDIVRNGQSVSVPVTLGGGNATFAVIDSGVVEGEMVSFTLPDIGSSNPFDAIRIGSGFGGGRTPGGGGGGQFGDGGAGGH